MFLFVIVVKELVVPLVRSVISGKGALVLHCDTIAYICKRNTLTSYLHMVCRSSTDTSAMLSPLYS